MKTKSTPAFYLFTFVFCLVLALSPEPCALCQTPQGFNYQAIARDSQGKEIINTSIQVKLSILSDTTGFKITGGGTYLWEEQQDATTNGFGMFNLVLGNTLAVKIQGTAASFTVIDWKAQPLYIGIKINYQSVWRNMGASRLWSVPYSMVSGELAGPVKKLAVSGTTSFMDEALFEVKNTTGQTVFAVYNEGVRVYVDDGIAKGTKGGFAIGSFGTAKAESQPLLVVDPDSIRAYIAPDAKGTKGGFAIGGFSPAKTLAGEEYLRVTRDSTRIYVMEPAKGVKGGFAIGSFNPAKGPEISPFTSLTPKNYFIGHGSGKLTSGLYNSFVGYETGLNNTSGSYNAFFGYQAGYDGTTGSSNLFLGYQSGFSNTAGNFNSFMGYRSGYLNTTGDKNTFIGSFAGVSNTIGNNNTFSGFNSGYSNADGHANNFYGTGSGYSNLSGDNNTFIGPESGYNNIAGSFNTFLGYRAGYNNNANNNVFIGNECGFSNTTGDLNVFIGYAAGRTNTEGSGNVFMGNGAGNKNIGGEANVFIGDRSGYENTYGSSNVFMGYLSGMQGTAAYSNVCIGYQSGMGLTNALNNVFVGSLTGMNNTWGESNVFIGSAAGKANITGGSNVHIGQGAGEKANASDNIFIGYAAGYETTTGASNLYIGMQAGYQNVSGQNNVFIGKYAGYYETGSNKLYIDNSLTTSPLIYGDFDLNNLTINGNLSVNSTYMRLISNPGTGTTPSYYCYQGAPASTTKANAFSVYDALWVTGPSFLDKALDINVSGSPALYVLGDEALWYDGNSYSWGYGGTYNVFADKVSVGTTASPGGYTLYVAGSAYSTGGWSGSDARWKKNLEPVKNVLPGILSLTGYRFDWKKDEYPEFNFDDERQIGLVAQEVEKIFPELVRTENGGYKSVSYEKLSVLLLEGIKEQQKQIDEARKDNDELQKEIQELKEQIAQIISSAGNR
jgi:hypothetical protein